jgi:hypothetical protein
MATDGKIGLAVLAATVRRLCAGGGSHERTPLCRGIPADWENTGYLFQFGLIRAIQAAY